MFPLMKLAMSEAEWGARPACSRQGATDTRDTCKSLYLLFKIIALKSILLINKLIEVEYAVTPSFMTGC
jgi:hypothetical protein